MSIFKNLTAGFLTQSATDKAAEQAAQAKAEEAKKARAEAEAVGLAETWDNQVNQLNHVEARAEFQKQRKAVLDKIEAMGNRVDDIVADLEALGAMPTQLDERLTQLNEKRDARDHALRQLGL